MNYDCPECHNFEVTQDDKDMFHDEWCPECGEVKLHAFKEKGMKKLEWENDIDNEYRTSRLRIPGGWLYRYGVHTMVFVPREASERDVEFIRGR